MLEPVMVVIKEVIKLKTDISVDVGVANNMMKKKWKRKVS